MASATKQRLALLVLLGVLLIIIVSLEPVVPSSTEKPTAPEAVGLPALPVDKDQLASEWQSTGGPYEQVIFALALGSSPRELYAGTWGDGLYHSSDGGQTWRATSPPGDQGVDLTKAQIRALAVKPDSQTVYLSYWDYGVWRSTDGGIAWEGVSGPLNNILPLHDDWKVDVLLIDKTDPTLVYQATWGGVYKSTNSGDFWEHKDVAPEVPWEEKPVYALIQAEDGSLYAGTFGAGVYHSSDHGETWQAMGPPKPLLACNAYALVTRDGVVWVGTQDGVYRTSDGGQKWEQVIDGFADDPDARTVQTLALDRDGNLYAGTIDFGVYRSADGGNSWEPYNEGLSGYALAILSLLYDDLEDTLYATTYGAGVYRNVSGVWEPLNGGLPAPAFDVQSLAFAGPEQELLLAGTFVGGLYASEDRGMSWNRWTHALPVGEARNVTDIVVLDEGRTIILGGGTGVYRSTDRGESWKKVGDGLPSGDHRVLSLAQGKSNPELIFSALEENNIAGIYRSDDGGEHWAPVSKRAGVDDLALSGDDSTLFAVHVNEGLTRSSDGGRRWQPLGKGITRYGFQVVVDERNTWQQLVLGFPHRSLHVLALDAIYSSHDDGRTWQPSLRGQFDTILADPVRPAMLYATAMTQTVPLEVRLAQAQVISSTEETGPTAITITSGLQQATQVTTTVKLADEAQYAFWVSHDDGYSWKQASISNLPLTTLAMDPLDQNQLLAGTPTGGVYYARLNPSSPYSTVRAVGGLIVFAILPAVVLGGLLMLYLYFLLVLRLRLYPWQVWALILRIPAWRLVSTPRSKLDPLEQLVARVAADLAAPFGFDVLLDELQGLGVVPLPGQVEGALHNLLTLRVLARDEQDRYRFALVALARLVGLNFEREALIEQVHSANLIARNAEIFFDHADFEVHALRDRLSLWPESPDYRALGRLNAWFHIHQPMEPTDVNRLDGNVDTGSRDLGFVVLDHIPQPGAFRAMQAARLIPLSSSKIRRAVEQRGESLALKRAIHEGRGQEDLFDLWEPLLDHLAFFGRVEVLDTWLAAIESHQDIFFWGLPRSGRTSALWWLQAKVPLGWLGSYVNLRFRQPDWQPLLRDLLDDLLLNLRRTYRRLLVLPELDRILEACGPGLDLEAGLDYLVGCGLPSIAHRFVFFLDGATPGAALDRFQSLADRRDDVTLVVSWDGMPSEPTDLNGDRYLLPLTSAESSMLLRTIGMRLGLVFDDSDLDALDRAAGGHPFLLRQLGSQIARLAGRPDGAGAGRVLRPGEWPALLEPERVPAETAIQGYLRRQPEALVRFWGALSPEVRRNMRLLAAGQPFESALLPPCIALGLLDMDESGSLRLRIGLLDRMLREGTL